MICVRYLQCQVNVIINKYATYTEKILKSSTLKQLLRAVRQYRGVVQGPEGPLYCRTANY